jgi:hypothetical protein
MRSSPIAATVWNLGVAGLKRKSTGVEHSLSNIDARSTIKSAQVECLQDFEGRGFFGSSEYSDSVISQPKCGSWTGESVA